MTTEAIVGGAGAAGLLSMLLYWLLNKGLPEVKQTIQEMDQRHQQALVEQRVELREWIKDILAEHDKARKPAPVQEPAKAAAQQNLAINRNTEATMALIKSIDEWRDKMYPRVPVSQHTC